MEQHQKPVDLSRTFDKSPGQPVSPLPAYFPQNSHTKLWLFIRQQKVLVLLGFALLVIIILAAAVSEPQRPPLVLPPGTTIINPPGQPPRLNHPLTP